MPTKTPTVDKLLTPSWLSGLIAVAGGLVVTAGVLLAFSFNNSQAQQQLTTWQNTSAPALTLPGQSPPGTDNNSLQNTWPLLGFWMVIGLVVYFVVESAAHAMGEAAEIKKELKYVHVRRDTLLRSTLSSVTLRFLAAVVWLLLIEVFFKRVIPYSITAAHASASDPLSLNAFLYALLSFVMVVLGLHLQVILARLCAGRARLFSTG